MYLQARSKSSNSKYNNIYLSGFFKRYLQEFLPTFSFQACLGYYSFLCYDILSTPILLVTHKKRFQERFNNLTLEANKKQLKVAS